MAGGTPRSNKRSTSSGQSSQSSPRADSDAVETWRNDRTTAGETIVQMDASETLLPQSVLTRPSGFVEVASVTLNWDEKECSSENIWEKQCARLKKRYGSYTWLDWLRIYDWRAFLMADVIAGISVGCMVVPQSISYATIAGLPAVYGLYTAFMPVLAYAVFGSSRQLSVGPVAVMSLLLSVGLSKIVPVVNPDPNNPISEEAQTLYNTLAIQASFLVAIIYILLGFVHLGFVTNFLSHSVISGFTSGAAIIIGFSQLKYVVGYPIRKSEHIYESIYDLFANIDQFKWYEFVMSVSFLAILLGMKHVGKTYKKFSWMRPLGPFTVTFISIPLVYFLRLDQNPGVKVVGNIPGGLPQFTGNIWFPMPHFSELLPVAITMTAVGLMESIAIAKALAEKNKYEIDANQELAGLGASNLMGAMFGAYPCTGSFSRSAVANDTGAKTGLAGAVTSMLVLLILLFITPVFEWMPFNALAAIVISGVVGLVEFNEMMFLFKVAKLDCLVWLTSFLCTLLLGVEIGLAIAVGLAMLIVIYQSAFPHTAVLGLIPRTTVYRNIKQYPDATTISGVVLIRIDSPIYFANVAYVKDRLQKYELRAEQDAEVSGSKVHFVIIDMSPVSHIDASAVHAIFDIHAAYQKRGVQLVLVNPVKQVQAMMLRCGMVGMIGREHIFVRMHDAVKFCTGKMLALHGRRSTLDGSSRGPSEVGDDAVVLKGGPLSDKTLVAMAQIHATEYMEDALQPSKLSLEIIDQDGV
eukprot:CAMPEP_0117680504 /NCGR_PEP_ID=MMETSP0804-20121206/18396_1 /TAXON_ID=1074897 /ORGANISM="Tetraselmis astigmatica, Strain CCMP880" /LENGTH=749 /DNA_ID=CAMNT_0005490023 /DNA_START=80 /DNA_END=2329 /DNA_ORIENTATION=-